MIHGMFIRAGMAFAALVSAAAVRAAVLSFSGTITGLGLASVDGTCPSPSSPAHGVLAASTSDGSATLGSSTYSHIGYDHDWCFSGPSGPISGTFNLYLGANTLFGSVTGMAGGSASIAPAGARIRWLTPARSASSGCSRAR